MYNSISPESLSKAIDGLKKYLAQSKSPTDKRKDLLEAGDQDSLAKVVIEVVFKNIPSNNKTYIHNVVLPNHWRQQAEPEDLNVALFVKHRRPENKAQKIQFARDRDLDIENSHSYYQQLFDQKLGPDMKTRISRIITIKELATEFQSFQKLDRLAKTYDLFISDKQLMANKMNPLPRRLGRRFWVREKKVPVMVKLESPDLKSRMEKAFSTEQFYVLGRSSTEKFQVGLIEQSTKALVENMQTFFKKLHSVYDDNIRFLRLKSNSGIALPLFADLNPDCSRVTMKTKRIRPITVVDDFDMLEGNAKVAVRANGNIKILRSKKRKRAQPDSSSDVQLGTKKLRQSQEV